jgi:hypothetical protein
MYRQRSDPSRSGWQESLTIPADKRNCFFAVVPPED